MKLIYPNPLNLRKTLRAVSMSLFCLVAWFGPAEVKATHFRYQSIKWQKINGSTNEVQFTISTAWRSSYYGSPSVGSSVNTGYTFFYGDGNYDGLKTKVTSVNSSEGWFYGETVLTHKYATGTKNYTAYFENCCRISTLENGADDDFRAESLVNIGTYNNSPSTTLQPIIFLPTGKTKAKFTIPGADGDYGDTLNFALTTIGQVGIDPLTNFAVTSKGEASFKTTGLSVGNLYTAAVKITDGKAVVFVDFIIQIVNSSNPPKFDYSCTPPDGYKFYLAPGDSLKFKVQAYDNDSNAKVSLSATGLPSGSTFPGVSAANPVSSVFKWTPTSGQSGTYVVSFAAKDNTDMQTITSVTIIVSGAPQWVVPPTPAENDLIVVKAGDTIKFTLKAKDSDTADKVTINKIVGYDNNGKPVNISDDLYKGVTISPFPSAKTNPTEAVFTWIPGKKSWGERTVTVTAEDSKGLKTDHTIHILVNTTPEFTSKPVTSACAGSKYVYNVEGIDPDLEQGDEVELHAPALPKWLTLKDNGDGTGTFSGTPSVLEVGDHKVIVYLEDIHHHDNVGGIPFQSFTITVSPAAIVTAGTDTSVCKGANASIGAPAKSGSTYAWNSSPAGFSSSASKATVSPTETTTYTLNEINANGCSGSSSVKVSVLPLPDAIAGSNASVCYGKSITIGGATVSGSTYSWSSNPSGFSSSVSNPSVTPASSTSFTLTETNTAGCKNSNSVRITVNSGPTVSISTKSSPVFCQGGNVVLVATPSETVTYSWSNGGTASTTNVNTGGTYSVTVTNANGCKGSASYSLSYDGVKLLSAYTMLAIKKIKIDNGSELKTGGAGVTGSKGKIDVNDNSKITGSSTFAKAYDIDVSKNSTVTNKYSGSPAAIKFPKFIENPYCDCKDNNGKETSGKDKDKKEGKDKKDCNGNDRDKKDKNDKDCKDKDKDNDGDDDDDKSKDCKNGKSCKDKKCKKHNSGSNDCPKDVKVKKGSKVTLADSIYGKIQIESGARVKFTSKVLYAFSIETGSKDTLDFDGCTRIALCNSMNIGENNVINSAGNGVVTYADGDVTIDAGTAYTGVIYAADGLKTKGGKNDRVAMTGMFFANSIYTTYTDVNWSTSCPSCNTMNNRNNSQFVFDNTPALREVATYVNVFPNPSNGHFNLTVNSGLEGAMKISVYRMNGQLIYTTDKPDFKGLLEMPLDLTKESQGVYIVRVELGNSAWVQRIQNIGR